MKATVEYQSKEQTFHFTNKRDFLVYLKSLEKDFIKSVSAKNIYGYERKSVHLLNSNSEKTEELLTYSAVFNIIGNNSNNLYESITVSLEGMEINEKFSFEDYLVKLFYLIFNSFFVSIDDVIEYFKIIGKETNNETMIELNDNMTLDQIKSLIGFKSFEVIYQLNHQQKVFYIAKKDNHEEFLNKLMNRTKTHKVSIRLINNMLLELFKIYKGIYIPERITNKELIFAK